MTRPPVGIARSNAFLEGLRVLFFWRLKVPSVIPSLSASGWLTEIAERADALMAYYVTSEYSQSYIYEGRITSLTYHIQQHGNDPLRLESRVTGDLQAYFGRYFDRVELEVRTDLPDPEDPNRINLRIDCIVYQGEYRYSIGREIRAANNKVIAVFNSSNGIQLN